MRDYDVDAEQERRLQSLQLDMGQRVECGLVSMNILTDCVRPGCTKPRHCESCGCCVFHDKCQGGE